MIWTKVKLVTPIIHGIISLLLSCERRFWLTWVGHANWDPYRYQGDDEQNGWNDDESREYNHTYGER